MATPFDRPRSVTMELEIGTPDAFDGANIGLRFAKLAVVVPIGNGSHPEVLLCALKGLVMQAACEKIEEHRERIVTEIEAAQRRAYGVES